jgi:effector-binding domain-containing protein
MDPDTKEHTAVQIETVQAKSQPMIYVRRTSSMAPDDIGKAMGEAFGMLGKFIGENNIAVAGPALSIYHDYSEKGVVMDIGFPVAAGVEAGGEIELGETPGGKALKAVHRGPYDTLRNTYDALGDHMKENGIPMPPLSWEVYVSDPATTPEAELVTEIFMPVE